MNYGGQRAHAPPPFFQPEVFFFQFFQNMLKNIRRIIFSNSFQVKCAPDTKKKLFDPTLALCDYSLGWNQVQKIFVKLTNVEFFFCFGSAALSLLFDSVKFGVLLQFLSPSGLFLVKGSVSKKSLGPNFVDNKLWFWKYSSNFLFFILATFGTSFALFRWCSHLKYDFFRSFVRSSRCPFVPSFSILL